MCYKLQTPCRSFKIGGHDQRTTTPATRASEQQAPFLTLCQIWNHHVTPPPPNRYSSSLFSTTPHTLLRSELGVSAGNDDTHDSRKAQVRHLSKTPLKKTRTTSSNLAEVYGTWNGVTACKGGKKRPPPPPWPAKTRQHIPPSRHRRGGGQRSIRHANFTSTTSTPGGSLPPSPQFQP